MNRKRVEGNMKIGDIVKYGYQRYSDDLGEVTGLIIGINEPGGTLKVLGKFGQVDWFVASYCKVVNRPDPESTYSADPM